MNIDYAVTSTIANLAELVQIKALKFENAELIASQLGVALLRYNLAQKAVEPEAKPVVLPEVKDHSTTVYQCDKCQYKWTGFPLPLQVCPRPVCSGSLRIVKEPANG